ncbi:MAG: hypothetical protein HY851_05115 [candidate division Zixibacteria bacterium]|nr:hypothetical protein [candidate division Zixibacteria bacterium]
MKRISHSRFVVLILGAGVISLLLSACGYDPNRPVYDTTLNPDDFPQDALTVLKYIQADTTANYSAITGAFGGLYTSHPDLLENRDWQAVIQKLGALFRYRADRLVSNGPSHYTRAAELYTLAAFARPTDARAAGQRDLFEYWIKAVEDSIVSDSMFHASRRQGLADRLNIAKAFLFDDSLSAVFAGRHLIPPLFYSSPQFNSLNIAVLDSLSAADRAFAAYLNLIQKPGRGRLAAFANPGVDLIAAEIIPFGRDQWCAALYFVPRQKIDSSLTVALRARRPGQTGAAPVEMTLDFQPATSTNRWKSGHVAVAFHKFHYSGPLVELLVGLYDNPATPRFMEIEGSAERLFSLPTGAISMRAAALAQPVR